VREELEETKTQLVSYETQLQQALEPVSPPAVVVCEIDTPATEPITEKTVFEPEEAEPDTIKVLQTEVQPKLLNPKQLAEWINEKHHPEKPITDQNVRDWYNPKKTCEEKRLENEKKYGHRLDHKDKKGTLWFTVD